MGYAGSIAAQLEIPKTKVSAAIELLDDGNTVPFVARYRKEATGGLDEEQLRIIGEQLEKLRALDERRKTVLKTITEQGQMTPELQSQIMAAATMTLLEDLYQPYKPKRRTRASIARERGLQPLADLILEQAHPLQSLAELAADYLNKEVPDVETAWAGARDIVAEAICDRPEVRGEIRQKALKWGSQRVEKTQDGDDPHQKFRLYYDFEFRVDRLRPHQVLAINRGEAEKVLRVRVDVAERDWQGVIGAYYPPDRRSPLAGQLEAAEQDGAQRLLLPSIERDVRRQLTGQAEAHAIKVFADNLRALLSQPPLAGHTVLGIDPGFRTGCKVAVVDPTGKVLQTATIYPHEPQRQRERSVKTLKEITKRHKISIFAIGNGTASRETESLVADLTREDSALKYLIVNEAGASVYSASKLARAELPDLDVSMRGAVSIARRVQDPLAELVKIDPKSIGVGMYQHDVDQKRLAESLAGVIENVVNSVGVDVNTASPALLAHVAGIGPKLAERIVAYRDEFGPFSSRSALRKVSGLGPKAFEQAAGFLRIREGDNPLDASAIHPESYPVTEKLMERAGLDSQSGIADRKLALDDLLARHSLSQLAGALGVGEPTLEDIIDQLARPGRDPRQDLPAPVLRGDVLKMEDLVSGMRLKGTVRNVVDFGAFVDIGVKQDGLLHRSKIPRGIELKVGYVLDVEILKIEVERGRISLGWPA